MTLEELETELLNSDFNKKHNLKISGKTYSSNDNCNYNCLIVIFGDPYEEEFKTLDFIQDFLNLFPKDKFIYSMIRNGLNVEYLK